MGCACSDRKSVDNLSEEEKLIIPTERMIGLSAISPNAFDRAISRYAVGDFINGLQMSSAYESLILPTEAFKDQSSPLYNFYKRFFKDSLGYKVTMIVCAGILLSNEDKTTKADLLFKNYDRDCSNSLDVQEYNVMMSEMMDVNVALIETTKILHPTQSVLLENYSKKLKKNKDFMSNYVHLLLSKGEVKKNLSLDEFKIAFKDPFIQKICTASGCRDLLVECNTMQAKIN